MGGNAALELTAIRAVVLADYKLTTVGLSEDPARVTGWQNQSQTLALENRPNALDPIRHDRPTLSKGCTLD